MNPGRFILTVALVIGVTAGARANSGTPLLWLGMLHLLIGNFVIGYLEALILHRLYRIDLMRAVTVMVIANYTSAFTGFYLINTGTIPVLVRPLIDQFFLTLGTVFGLAFLITLIIEMPFVRFIFKRDGLGWRPTFAGLIIIHMVTYAMMTSLYFYVSDISLYSKTKTVPLEKLFLPDDIVIIYVEANGGSLVVLNHDGSEIKRLTHFEWEPRGVIYKRETGTADSSVHVLLIRGAQNHETRIVVQEGRMRIQDGGSAATPVGLMGRAVFLEQGLESSFRASGLMGLRVSHESDERLQYGLFGHTILSPYSFIGAPIIVAPDIVLFHESFNGVLALNMRTREIAHVVKAANFAVLPRDDFEAWLETKDQSENQ